MANCFDCGLPLHPDHTPRTASGQVFHPTPSHCVSALLADVARLTSELEAAREGEEWFITRTQTAIALLGHVPRHESLSASCELWIAQARKRLVAIGAARKAEDAAQ